MEKEGRAFLDSIYTEGDGSVEPTLLSGKAKVPETFPHRCFIPGHFNSGADEETRTTGSQRWRSAAQDDLPGLVTAEP